MFDMYLVSDTDTHGYIQLFHCLKLLPAGVCASQELCLTCPTTL
jgi:hypothetical protein